jgi:hypothetical protein
MAYSDFTFDALKKTFHLHIIEHEPLFPHLTPTEVSPLLEAILKDSVPLAHAISTEKARSEMIIAPVLLTVKRLYAETISLFSGVEFAVDTQMGLNGTCDFIITRSREQFYISQPVLIVVEAKNEQIKTGLPQCIAAMVAAQLFNAREENGIDIVYGCVTTGTVWKFLRLSAQTLSIDYNDYYIRHVGEILAVFEQMIAPQAPAHTTQAVPTAST